MPVSVPQIDWQAGPVSFQLRLQCGNQIACLLVDRALASEVVIVLGYSEKTLARNILPPQYGFEEGNHVFPGFWPAEGYNKNCVVVHRIAFADQLSFELIVGSAFLGMDNGDPM